MGKNARTTKRKKLGRPKRDPDTLRTSRLVTRIHPDLMSALKGLANANGITRSMLVERTLISFVQLADPRVKLDHMGRRVDGEIPTDEPLGTPASFNHVWGRVMGAGGQRR
jgi:hypothetical protein